MADLNRRILVSTVAVSAVALLLAFSSYFFVSVILMMVVALLAGIGVWEYARLGIEKGMRLRSHLMVLFAVLEVIAFYTSLVFVDFPKLPILVLVCAAVVFFLAHFNEISDALSDIAIQFFGICYVSVPLSLLLGILYPLPHQGVAQEGRWWLAYLILVTKITDIGAYFVGRLWGRHQLSASLSPNKTIEGAIAGWICAILASCGMYFFAARYLDTTIHLTLIESLYLGALIGIFGQIGDLAESLLKRDAFVKDSNTLPGFGGVLDLLDSLLLTIPVLYFFLCMH
ncbi:MAG: phosphatidate cytidylyltransferase [Chlamydiales bacterium]|nr:phosphatidate cytidylyltransferase [Chlamydiales bacterium]